MGRLGLGLGLGLALGLQLGIGIGFRRNHSWSSIFTPRRNHSLCLLYNTKYVDFFDNPPPPYHRLNGSSSPVLTATCLSYGSL